MKTDIHPDNYRTVVFQDSSNGAMFIARSTAKSEGTVTWEDGNEYPLVITHISSASHPFFTGKEKLVDIEGRVDRFKAKTEKAKALRAEKAARSKTPEKEETKEKQATVQKLGAKPTAPKKNSKNS